MSANLGATTYTSVTWTAGDTITEAKLDNMVANDQAYDSHAAQGYLANNNKSFAGKDTGGTAYNAIQLNSSDDFEVGDSDLSGADIDLTNNPNKRKQAYSDLVTATDGTTVTFDLADGPVQVVTLGGNRTLALSNVKVGQAFIIMLKQDGTGSRTVSWFSTIRWADATAPTLTTTANARDVFGFYCASSGVYYGFFLGMNYAS